MSRLCCMLMAACLAGIGCSLKLPEIPPSHPANAEAPPGQIYVTPAVLEVTPIVQPPHGPASMPSGPGDPHEDHGMQQQDHGLPHESSSKRTLQQMHREGQRHD